LAEHNKEAIPGKWIPNERINDSIRQILGVEARVANRFSRLSIEQEVVETVSESMSGTGGGGD
jgi:hypothetical protein